MNKMLVGSEQTRTDGPAKVSGQARYAAEFPGEGLLHGVALGATIAHGRIAAIDVDRAAALPGVVRIYTHLDRPRTAWFDSSYSDDVAPPGTPFRPLRDAEIAWSGQPIALVVATDFEIARHAATLIDVRYDTEPHATDLHAGRQEAYDPPKKRSGIPPPPDARGDAEAAWQAAPVQLDVEYGLDREYHNPMEPHATTVIVNHDDSLVVHDKIQGVQATQKYVCSVFGYAKDKVHVQSPFIGGGFGCGLRPQWQLFLAVLAARDLSRSVRVVMTRAQMFSFTYRPETLHHLRIGADGDGRLRAMIHDTIGATSRFEDYQEAVTNWSGLNYACANASFSQKLAALDCYTPGDMRAPGAPTGQFALESAMDELAYKVGIDPLALRLLNYAEQDGNDGKPFTSKALREAYAQGAAAFGWSARSQAPRSMQDGGELIGWGCATGTWEAMMMPHEVSAALDTDGLLTIGCATADIGTGTYTILAQIAADAMGLEIGAVRVRLGDSSLPQAPVEGGSWTAASAGNAVVDACDALRVKLLEQARGMDGSPLANMDMAHVRFAGGRLIASADESRSVSLADIVRGAGQGPISADGKAGPDAKVAKSHAAYTHSAIFAEVRVDAELATVRVTRIVAAIAAGRIVNPLTARSQIIGGVVFGMGMALFEEAMIDHRLGRVMNRNLAEYHVPANADVPPIEVVFVDEQDRLVNPLGIKGLGEIGLCGTPGAIANAIFHATGTRVRSLPITIDKLLD